MKKILIFYGSYGGGHLSAAKSISKYLEETYGKKIEVQTVDCIEYINKYITNQDTQLSMMLHPITIFNLEYNKKLHFIYRFILGNTLLSFHYMLQDVAQQAYNIHIKYY